MNTLIIIKNIYLTKLIMHTYKMGTVKQMNIKNRTYYFYNDITDLESFNQNC